MYIYCWIQIWFPFGVHHFIWYTHVIIPSINIPLLNVANSTFNNMSIVGYKLYYKYVCKDRPKMK